MRSAPLGLPLWRAEALIATWFGVGLMPVLPGTWASLAALPIGWILMALGGPAALAAAAALLFAIGCWASGRVAAASGLLDPNFIVVDEVAAQWLALLPAPLDWRAYAVAFIAFRVFDIFKPWPANIIDRRLKGGFGIMLDDVAAAFYAALILVLIGQGVFGVRP
ncbi:MAG: phosphatidylglycerophosphatase A [Thiohalocapsa sp.]